MTIGSWVAVCLLAITASSGASEAPTPAPGADPLLDAVDESGSKFPFDPVIYDLDGVPLLEIEKRSWRCPTQDSSVAVAESEAEGSADVEEEEEMEGSITDPIWIATYVIPCVVLFLGLMFCHVQHCKSGASGRQHVSSIIELGKIKLHGTVDDEAPVEGTSSKIPILEGAGEDEAIIAVGYKENLLGLALFCLVLLVALGYFILYVMFTFNQSTAYYQEWWEWMSTQVVTIILFHTGAIWYFGLSYNKERLRSLFRTQCPLAEATHVAIWTPTKVVKVRKSEFQQKLDRYLEIPGYVFERFFTVLFGIQPIQPDPSKEGRTDTVKVQRHFDGTRYFDYELRRFVYDSSRDVFDFGRVPPKSFTQLCHEVQGLTSQQALQVEREFGPNRIYIPVPSYFSAIISEFTKGFYVYQLFVLLPWYFFDYYHMGLMTWGMCITGGIAVALSNRANRAMLASLVKEGKQVSVRRDGEWQVMPETNLVPGDVLLVQAGPAPCDMVLVAGSCTVDESMLTGESLPVQKTAAQPSKDIYDAEKHIHRKHTILCGTVVIDSAEQGERIAVATRTGGQTFKGEQVRTILFPARIPFKFYSEVRAVMVFLVCYAIFGLAITMAFLDKSPPDAWYYAMYVVAAAIPPLLPTVFVVSLQIAVGRLKGKDIICSVPERLLMAGKVSVCCFDKTGTLTKQGLDFHGFHPIHGDSFAEKMDQPGSSNALALQGMASACSVTEVELEGNRQLVGSSVDVKMFEATGWNVKLENNGQATLTSPGGEKLTVLRRFEFDPHVVRMSVVARDSQGVHHVFCKGSYEAIGTISVQTPGDYHALAEQYAKEGCYVLSLGHRLCTETEVAQIASNEPVDRKAFEESLSPLGLIVFKNDLKPDTAAALSDLRNGNVRCVMITGDNALTGAYIARECGMVPADSICLHGTSNGDQVVWHDDVGKLVELPKALDHNHELFVNGAAFRLLLKNDQLIGLMPHIRVYARMQPDDKKDCINSHIEAGIVTGMCGDGGNDCNALRAAHVGIALSGSDASVVSPFTDLNMSVRSVVDVLIEGRSTLVTSFSGYKFMVMYGQLEAVNQIVNAYFGVTFSEWSWLFLDGIFVIVISWLLSLAKPASTLGKERPTSALLGPTTMLSVMIPNVMNLGFLMLALHVLYQQDWMACRKFDEASGKLSDWWTLGDNYECATIFLISGSQYIHAGAQYNVGGQWRKAWIFNWPLVVALVAFYAMMIYIMYVPSVFSCLFRVNCVDEYQTKGITQAVISPVNNWEHSTLFPSSFRSILLTLIIVNGVVNCAVERFLILGPVASWFRWKRGKNEYLKV